MSRDKLEYEHTTVTTAMAKLKKILIALSIVLALGSVVLLSCIGLYVRAIKVPTGSMANTIVPGDHLIVLRNVGEIRRGDIVVFRFPRDQSVLYVCRVIGLPAETIEVRDRLVQINGSEIPEQRITVKADAEAKAVPLEEISSEGSGPYRVFYWPRDGTIEHGYPDEAFGTRQPFRIPEDQYFVMGDNRDNSYDSRFYGPVPRELIWGKPIVIYLSNYNERILKRIE